MECGFKFRQTTKVCFSNINVIILKFPIKTYVYHIRRSSDKVAGFKAVALARPLL